MDTALRWNQIKVPDSISRVNDALKNDNAFNQIKALAKAKNEFSELRSAIDAATISSSWKKNMEKDKIKLGTAEPISELNSIIAKIPPNPIHGTNERLDGLIERFDRFEMIAEQTVQLVHSMNTAALGLLESFANGARDTEKFSKRSILIAGMALAVAILTPIIQSINDGQKEQETKHFVESAIQQIINSEQKTSDTVRSVMSEYPKLPHSDYVELEGAILSLSAEIRALREKSSAHPKR
jgi:hypothetical protein